MRRTVQIADLVAIVAFALDNHDVATVDEVSAILFGIARIDCR